MSQIFPDRLFIINIGARLFYETAIEQSVQSVHVNWPPPRKELVEKEILEILDRIGGGDDE
jgi:hypothetical protein